jgi:hypothetical protein
LPATFERPGGGDPSVGHGGWTVTRTDPGRRDGSAVGDGGVVGWALGRGVATTGARDGMATIGDEGAGDGGPAVGAGVPPDVGAGVGATLGAVVGTSEDGTDEGSTTGGDADPAGGDADPAGGGTADSAGAEDVVVVGVDGG